MTKIKIAIIGGGACGIAAYIDLFLKIKLKTLNHLVQIFIIEKDKEVGRGLAFGTNQPGHVLNTQADLMGIHAFEPAHFSDWLQKNKPKEEVPDSSINDNFDNTHATRRLYSAYLQEQFFIYFNHAKEIGLDVKIVHDKALNLVRNSSGWIIKLKEQDFIVADVVILAPGTPKPNNYPELEGKSCYIDFPWPSQPILEIPSDASVAVLGSSLSAIDTLITLMDNKHLGNISLYSPDGLLPRVQPIVNIFYERQFLTLENVHKLIRTNFRLPKIEELFELFKKESEHFVGLSIDWKETARKGKAAQKLLEEDIEVAKSGGDAFVNILYSLRYDTPTIWSWLSNEEKVKFIRWMGNYWNINRHAMPMINAMRIMKLFDNKQLRVKANLKEVKYNDQNKSYLLQYEENELDEVQYLINATGPANDIKQMKSTLLQNLYNSGILEAHKAGGIKINPEKMQVVSNNVTTENLFAVGHLCNGALLDVNSVWFNVKTIHTMSEYIVKDIIKRSST